MNDNDELLDYGGYKLDTKSDHLKDILIDLGLNKLDLLDAHRLIMNLFNPTTETVDNAYYLKGNMTDNDYLRNIERSIYAILLMVSACAVKYFFLS